jgi:hypothetical protein
VPVPPDPVLRAAARWLERLPSSSAARCRALFTSHHEFGDITPTQYDAAYAWLSDTGLLDDLHSPVPVEHRIFGAAVPGTPWFADADVLVQRPDEIPDDAARAAEVLGLPEPVAFAQISATWGKVDAEARARVGAAGELALVELLVDAVDARVEHVSVISDGFGFDIAVSAGGRSVHLEVKSTSRRGRIIVYLSRHEFETMVRDPAWQLVVVRLEPEALRITEVGTVSPGWIAKQVPIDKGQFGRWESCRLDLSDSVVQPGLEAVGGLLKDDVPRSVGALFSGVQ